MSDNSHHDTSEQPIDDPEQYYERRRMEEIGDARLETRETKREVKQLEMSGELSTEDAMSIYQAAVEAYIMEVEPLLLNEYPDRGGAELWTDCDLGEMTIYPPQEFTKGNTTITPDTPPQPERLTFTGLRSIIETPSPIRARFTTQHDQIVGGRKEFTGVKRVPIREHILDRAVRSVNLFLSDVGMDVQASEDSEWEI